MDGSSLVQIYNREFKDWVWLVQLLNDSVEEEKKIVKRSIMVKRQVPV